jgi:hypothetical protein
MTSLTQTLLTEDAEACTYLDGAGVLIFAAFARDYPTVARDDHRLFVDAVRDDGIAGGHSTRQD